MTIYAFFCLYGKPECYSIFSINKRRKNDSVFFCLILCTCARVNFAGCRRIHHFCCCYCWHFPSSSLYTAKITFFPPFCSLLSLFVFVSWITFFSSSFFMVVFIFKEKKTSTEASTWKRNWVSTYQSLRHLNLQLLYFSKKTTCAGVQGSHLNQFKQKNDRNSFFNKKK